LKNIDKLNVKLYEVNSENFLLKENGKDFNNIELSYTIPYEEKTYTYNQPAFLVHQETLKFDKISSTKLGVFILYLIGVEMFAKAIITKGRISLMYDNIIGRNAMLIDDN